MDFSARSELSVDGMDPAPVCVEFQLTRRLGVWLLKTSSAQRSAKGSRGNRKLHGGLRIGKATPELLWTALRVPRDTAAARCETALSHLAERRRMLLLFGASCDRPLVRVSTAPLRKPLHGLGLLELVRIEANVRAGVSP